MLLAHVHIPSSSCRGVVDRWAHILISTSYTTNKHQQTIHDNMCLVVYLDLLGNGGWKKSDKHIPQMVVKNGDFTMVDADPTSSGRGLEFQRIDFWGDVGFQAELQQSNVSKPHLKDAFVATTKTHSSKNLT